MHLISVQALQGPFKDGCPWLPQINSTGTGAEPTQLSGVVLLLPFPSPGWGEGTFVGAGGHPHVHDAGSQAGRPLGAPPGPLLKVDSPSLTHLPTKVEEPPSESSTDSTMSLGSRAGLLYLCL